MAVELIGTSGVDVQLHCGVPWSIKSHVILQLKLRVAVGSIVQFEGKVTARIDPKVAPGPAAGTTQTTVPGTVPTTVRGMSIRAA